jgi:hypothetical protein
MGFGHFPQQNCVFRVDPDPLRDIVATPNAASQQNVEIVYRVMEIRWLEPTVTPATVVGEQKKGRNRTIAA